MSHNAVYSMLSDEIALLLYDCYLWKLDQLEDLVGDYYYDSPADWLCWGGCLPAWAKPFSLSELRVAITNSMRAIRIDPPGENLVLDMAAQQVVYSSLDELGALAVEAGFGSEDDCLFVEFVAIALHALAEPQQQKKCAEEMLGGSGLASVLGAEFLFHDADWELPFFHPTDEMIKYAITEHAPPKFEKARASSAYDVLKSRMQSKLLEIQKWLKPMLTGVPFQIKNTTTSKAKQVKLDNRHLYLMKCERTGFVKIGVSKNPQKRESTLQSEKPDMKLIGSWPGAAKFEKDWHSKFSDLRKRGEWFELSASQVALVASVCSKGVESIQEFFNATTKNKIAA